MRLKMYDEIVDVGTEKPGSVTKDPPRGESAVGRKKDSNVKSVSVTQILRQT